MMRWLWAFMMVSSLFLFITTSICVFIDLFTILSCPEFLLGDRILAAPVINKGENFRHVYLPRGNWYDPNQNKTHTGPIWLMEYPAPIDVLPYFIREKP